MMLFYFGLIAAAGVIAALSGTALSYDGSWYLFKLLDLQSPYIPVHRYINIPLHWPVLLVSRFTADLRLLRVIFSFIYMIVPLIALIASWWVVREKRPSLFVWPALGIGMGMLPGQIFCVGESMLAIPFFWPILLGIVTGIQGQTIGILVLFSVGVFLAHPVAIPYFALAACLAFLFGYRSKTRPLYLWGIGFLLLAVGHAVKFFLLHSPYEKGELSLHAQIQHFYASAAGLPLISLALAFATGLLLFLRQLPNNFDRSNFRVFSRGAEIFSLTTAGIVLVIWARDPARWRNALDFRDLAVFSSLPFMFLAVANCGDWCGILDRWPVAS